MKAVKGNKEYDIVDAQKNGYQAAGFDIENDDGETIAYGKGKTVPYDEYLRLVKENEALHTRIAELEALQEKSQDEVTKKNTKGSKEKDGE